MDFFSEYIALHCSGAQALPCLVVAVVFECLFLTPLVPFSSHYLSVRLCFDTQAEMEASNKALRGTLHLVCQHIRGGALG